jgi:hypothetical protein
MRKQRKQPFRKTIGPGNPLLTDSYRTPIIPLDWHSLHPYNASADWGDYRSGPTISTITVCQRAYVPDPLVPGWGKEQWIDKNVVVPPNSLVHIGPGLSLRFGRFYAIRITPPSEYITLPTTDLTLAETGPSNKPWMTPSDAVEKRETKRSMSNEHSGDEGPL